ncbi:MAG: glycerol-3-phosphate 1-O-acyltransferase PlsY [Microcystaceae cyanobacterium]
MNTTTTAWLWSVGLILVAYLFGSIPTGYWAGKLLKGIDIRQEGSGSTGATNVLRTLGKVPGIAVLSIDILKGMGAVGLVSVWYQWGLPDSIPEAWQAALITLTAIAAIVGHSKSIWLNFTGGKSVATSLGVLFVMNPWVALGTLGSFLVTIALTRIVSISSIIGAIAVSVLMIIFQQPLPYLLFGIVGGIYVIVRHKTNIARLLAGTEPKLGQKLENAGASTD